jgi:hypothetical protein
MKTLFGVLILCALAAAVEYRIRKPVLNPGNSMAPSSFIEMPAAVNLATTCSFGVLAGSTITNTGATQISGNIGLSPGSAVTGFPPGTVTGLQHTADSTAVQAKIDLLAAYKDAASRTGPVALSGNIGGQTLTPGVYNSISSLTITAGDLVLDAQGNADAVWIFQISTSIVSGAGRQVLLVDGALASNVFWQVGTFATFGTTSVMQGTVMASSTITMSTGAVLNGRAFAMTAAVSMDTNTVNVPAC